MKPRGELAIVLHTHMPYVEGFGTWPFGEEWLWEAIATSYLPLLNVLGRAPITLSLTPVLCDQLEAPGALDRCLTFLEEIRPESHARDIAGYARAGQTALHDELVRSATEYAAAARTLRGLGGGLLTALGRHATWTSAATHPVLPLLATDPALSLQIETGVVSHRRRFGDWAGGFWLPECAHAPWLNESLEAAGVRASCVELTGVFGVGDPRNLAPLLTAEGPVLWPIDRAAMSLVWSTAGYPSAASYRDHHALTPHHHRVWRNDGAAYDPIAGRAQAQADARDFVNRIRDRVANGGLCVCALDTELLGHWWHEGVVWLEAVLEEADRQDLSLTTLDDALERHEPAPAPPDLGTTSWGEGGDLRTWSAPAVADLAWASRRAELELLRRPGPPPARALRELLALQSSDWAFLITREQSGPYPRERAAAHQAAFETALLGTQGPALRNLAPELHGWLG